MSNAVEKITPSGSIDIKRAVQEGNKVFLSHVEMGKIWYKTRYGEFFFVPFADVGDATFNQVDKAILFMRYMRMWNKYCENPDA